MWAVLDIAIGLVTVLLIFSLVDTAAGIVGSGQVGDVKIDELRERAPTQAEWQSMRPVLERLRTAPGTLPIGYECLGAAFALPDTEKEPGAQRTVWTACLQQAQRVVASGSPANGVLKLLGWLLTAAAGTLGAGYWFGLLTKAINIRGTGPKPVAQSTTDNAQPP